MSEQSELNDRITPDLLRRMLGRALIWTRNEADAADLVQDVLAKVVERTAEPLNGHFEGWLFTIMRHRWIDKWRQRKTQPTVSLENPEFLDEAGLDSAAESDTPVTKADVDQFLQTLIGCLRADSKRRLAKFVEAIAEVGWNKQLIAEKMNFSEVRSVDAYRSDLEKWCKVNGLRKEHYFGILAPIVLATFSGTASAATTTTGTAATAGTAKVMTWSFAASIIFLAMFAGSGGDQRATAAAANIAQVGKFAPAGDAPGIGEKPVPVRQKNDVGFRPAADIPGF